MAVKPPRILTKLEYFILSPPLLLSSVTLLVIVLLIRFLCTRPKKLNLPNFPDAADHRNTLLEGALKYPNTPFIIQTSPPLVILPTSCINEIKTLPESKVSFIEDIRRTFFAKHTGIGRTISVVPECIRVDLTRHIASKLGDLQEEARYGFEKELGPCDDWTPVPVYEKMTRIVTLLSGRVFVGRPLSREEEWIDINISYTLFCVQARAAIEAYPPWMRDIVAPYLKEVRGLWQFKRRGAMLLKPMIDKMLAKKGAEKLFREGESDEQGTMMSWILSRTPLESRSDAMLMGESQMSLSMAAIHTTSMATTGAIYDLATYPEYIAPLREEIQKILDEDGHDIDIDGFLRLKKSSLPKLWKLDSFLKESQRLTPPALTASVRTVISPITLSTGHVLPTGTRFCFSGWVINLAGPSYPSSSSLDIKPPSEFDAFRFSTLRSIPGNENKHQFVTTSPESVNFGQGNHACPGRFFASNEIKVVLIELLRHWDVRLKGGEGRPKNVYNGLACRPDTRAEIEFRRRKT